MKRLATAITWEELTALPADSVLLADVRDEVAFGHGTLPGAVRVDLADITAGRHALPRDRTIVCFCMRGVLSEEAADALTGQGWTARNLAGGYAQWLRGQMARQTADREKLDRIFGVNLGGCYNCIQAALPAMLHAHSGCIVNTSSIWGIHGASCEAAYSSSKHAVVGLSRSLAAELAPSGIRVNCVAPGVIDTDMVKVLGQETLEQLARDIPLGRLGAPEDIAQAVLYLASANYVTGQVLTVDGGFIPA